MALDVNDLVTEVTNALCPYDAESRKEFADLVLRIANVAYLQGVRDTSNGFRHSMLANLAQVGIGH